MNIDFFAAECPEGVDIDKLLAAAQDLAAGEPRSKEIDHVTFRLQELQRGPRYWEGDLTRIRMSDLPVIASTDGDRRDLDLDDDEGLGEDSAFLYDTKTHLIAMQSNRLGVSPGKWCRFFENVGGLQEPIVLVPVLRKDAAGMIKRAKEVRNFTVKFAEIKNPRLLLGDKQDSLNDAIEILGGPAPQLELTVAMGHKKGGLPNVKHILRKLFGLESNVGTKVEKLEFTATLDDDTKQTVDLLNFRLRESIDVKSDSRTRSVPYALRRGATKDAWESQRSWLETAYLDHG